MYDKPLYGNTKDAIRDYTLSNSVPFGRLLNPAFDQSVTRLFTEYEIWNNGEKDMLNIPLSFQLTGMFQGLISVALLFLIGLGIRNYFKIG